MAKIDYKRSGVDVEKADQFIKDIGPFVTAKKINKVSAFGSLFDFKNIAKNYKNPVIVSSTDGVGTKLKLAQKFKAHQGVGIDLVAMNVNDIICLGAKPLFFLDYIACGKLNPAVLKQIIKGVSLGLSQSNCSLLGGETAEMPGMYKADEYDLAGFCVGVAEKGKIINGLRMKAGDKVIGISSSGPHSNGFSLIRKALNKEEIIRYKNSLLKPTRIYVKPVLALLSSYRQKTIKGIAHITGGAFYNKATKIVPQGLGLAIDKKSWRPNNIFRKIQKKGKLNQVQMYSVFNMGIGLIVIVDKASAKKILTRLNRSFKSYIIGEVVRSKEKLLLG
ncbi:MAG: phosphoribosylformylglycinamidine cyclo-ligase [Candidatus Omnitrophica bacterium]|nr:phosphoribosylformylglycinamidine cyclo-ligase [Candidatus Omnitrophota bacterium]MCF7897520.1 phosphoribosylformylglycinamidine cyclo-ligase [Candidatus Omnitrophota bacterium]MCF7909083.1 phosphoribosylformylglycinamidine cyclo-ligase [Candidatus Omnitrophota bacterium]